MAPKTWVVLFFTLALILLTTTSHFATTAHAKDDGEKLQYGVMIDAGSSGTRTFIYSWKYRSLDAESDQIGPLSRPITQEGWSKKAKIPISDYATKPDQVGELLQMGIEFATTTLTSLKVSNMTQIPIFLGATAGARMMKQSERVALFSAIRKYYHSDKSPFEFKDHYAKVLSGEEEGFFGFLAVNYLTGKLYPQPKTDDDKKKQMVSADPIFLDGAFDMGGASTQITFDTRGDDVLESYFEYSTPDEQRYATYTHSFLQFGLNQWWTRLNDLATKDKPNQQPVVMKCLGEGFEYEWTNSVSQKTYKIVGAAGNHWVDCRAENASLLFLDTTCLTDSCSVNGAYQPSFPAQTTMYAFSGFSSMVASYEPDWNAGKLYSTAIFSKLGQDLCGLSLAQLKERFPKADVEFLPRACSGFAYFHALTADAYRLPADVEMLKFVKEIEKTEVSWALGRMVYEVNLRNYDRILPSVPGNITFWIAIIILIGALAGVIVLLLSTWNKMNKANNSADTFTLLDGNSNNNGYV